MREGYGQLDGLSPFSWEGELPDSSSCRYTQDNRYILCSTWPDTIVQSPSKKTISFLLKNEELLPRWGFGENELVGNEGIPILREANDAFIGKIMVNIKCA